MSEPLPFASDSSIQGLYRHYKGKLYRILGTGKHSETLEKYVIYQALYGSYETWIRPFTMFFESVKFEDTMCPRFQKIDGEKQ